MEFRPERERIREQKKEEPKEIEEIMDKIEEVYPIEKINKLSKVFDLRKRLSEKVFLERLEILERKIFNKIPEIQPKFLEKVLSGLIERWKEKRYKPDGLGLFISFLINTTVEKYIQAEKEKGKKLEEIKPLKVSLDIQNLPRPPQYLAFRNPEKSHLTIKQDGVVGIGNEMRGGKVIVEGECGMWAGNRMGGGEIIIKGPCRDAVGQEMRGGEITIEGRCEGFLNAYEMTGGRLIFQGGVEGISPSAFTKKNRGEIWVKEEGRMKRIHPMIIGLEELGRPPPPEEGARE